MKSRAEYMRQWRAANPEKYKAYAEKRREYMREYMRRYRKSGLASEKPLPSMAIQVGGYTFTPRRAKPGVGTRHGSSLSISVTFDEETFEQVRERAAKAQVSFGEQVRQLVEFGLMDVEAAEARP